MSLNPDIGHLYHDNSISNTFTALDAKEKMKTREINARESKYLDKYTHVLDRAKTVCRRQNEWEQRNIRKQLDNIKSKTPSLSKSLRLESERIKVNSDLSGGNRKGFNSINRDGGVPMSTKHSKKQVRLSTWSVYSHVQADKHVATHIQRIDDKTIKDNSVNSSYIGTHEESNLTQKNVNILKKADVVTKTLHKLYTAGVERKWRENNMTVLDVLGKGSKEELEKALFVLRGTPVGDTIEDILKEKELVSKRHLAHTKVLISNKDGDTLSDDVLITKEEEENTPPETEADSDIEYRTLLGFSSANFDHCKLVNELENIGGQSASKRFDFPKSASLGSESSIKSDRIPSNRWSDPGIMSSNRWSDTSSKLDMHVNEVFERDDSWIMSSTLANPSETDMPPSSLRWTQIFKAPELWKRRGANDERSNIKTKPKHLSVVTLTGKHKQTMLK